MTDAAADAECILFRADASSQIGTGHVMRCLALARRWLAARESAVFAMAESTPAIAARLHECPVKMIGATPGSQADAEATIAVAQEMNARWIVVDGYVFRADYHRALRAAGLRVLLIDDEGTADCAADIVLNQNVYASAEMYPAATARLLLGPRYALLRGDFAAVAKERREPRSTVQRVLVTFGGADPAGVTAIALEALAPRAEWKRTLIIGGSNPRGDELTQRASATGMDALRDVTNMPELLSQCDLAVAAAGTTALELACLGVPALLVILAENQRRVAAAMEAAGAAINLGEAAALSAERLRDAAVSLANDITMRRAMSQRGRELVDGKGCERVFAEIRAASLTLRPATEEDAKLLWDWTNDEAVRAVSFQSAPIPWEEHTRWLTRKLADQHSRIFIVHEQAGNPIGVARFDWNGSGAAPAISVSLGAQSRGRGWGAPLIRRACEQFFAQTGFSSVRALIKKTNAASLTAFQRADFASKRELTINGAPAVELTLERQ